MRPNASRACWKDADLDLSLGEYNIVYLLASNVGRYVTYRAIYDRLHYEGFIAGSGADGYRANVRSAIRRIRNKFRSIDPTFDKIENYSGFVLLEEARLNRPVVARTLVEDCQLRCYRSQATSRAPCAIAFRSRPAGAHPTRF